MSNAIQVNNLTKHYNGLVAVDHVNFQVQQGEVFGFLGPNGAGKTTTIKMLTGLLRPTEGTAQVNGHDIGHDLHRVKRSIGVVPEGSNVYGELSGWDNLLFAAELYNVGRSERKRRAKKLLQQFELYERRRAKVKGYSRGMKRRLTIAMALIHHPRILFLDEPTTALDVRSAAFVRDLVRQMKGEGITVFLTTHYIEEADQLCDRVAILNQGQIVADDTPEKLKHSVLSVHTVEVSFDGGSQSVSLSDLEAIPCCDGVMKQGTKFRLYTQQPEEVLPGVMRYAESHDLRVISLNTLKPRLEDVFLEMTAAPGSERSGQ